MATTKNSAKALPRHHQVDLDGLLKRIAFDQGKRSFLVFKNNKYITIPTDEIAFIFIRYASSTIMTFQKEEYPLVQSLDQIQDLVSPRQFFRVNRQYLINFQAVKEVEHYFARKLLVKLVVAAPEKLLVPKEKVSVFLNWLEDR